MSVKRSKRCTGVILSGVALFGVGADARADVTVEEKTAFDLALFKANGTTTDEFTADKKRENHQFRCEGFMSLLCGKNDSAEITRLDKSTIYRLEPAKKRYREEPFPTVEQRAEARRRMAEIQEKMKQCPPPPAAKPTADPSKCQMSPPKLEVKNLGSDGQILGHDVHHSVVRLTQSCANKDTGDVCDFQFGFDMWLTQDKIAGLDERAAFEKAYIAKLGLVGENGIVTQQQVQMALAPYAEQMKQLRAKMGDLKGLPLRTAFALSSGGPSCGASKKASADAGGSGSDSSGPPTSLGDVGGKLLMGMFAKKRKADADAAAAAETHKSDALDPGMVSIVKFSTETTAVRTDSIPADRFEVPAGWTKEVPKADAEEKPFECPKYGKGE